ncbi:hypothetical protein PBRA_007621 [Plasmodiophora brassicae]|uniref:Transcription elongation factor S-II n=1 Tax=Plasmodiophora brassicae TaxID=37360 RepID=A0A0G4IXB1_PLABS|nr:hypothetical protein PBRA_007621 [Plasmodiophora brassicae]
MQQADVIETLQSELSAAIFDHNEQATLAALTNLSKQDVDVDILKRTGVGVTVGKLRKHSSEKIRVTAAKLVKTWKGAIAAAPPAVPAPEPSPASTLASPRDSTMVCAASRQHRVLNAPLGLVSAEEFRTGDSVRDKIRSMLLAAFTNLDDENDRMFVVLQIEDGLYRHFGNTQKEYKNQFRNIMFNLKDKSNPDFRDNVCNGAIHPGELAQMDPKEMASKDLKALREEHHQEAKNANRSDLNRNAGATDMFKCGRCKQSKTTFYQMQTRSADEPMTTFITCTVCNNRWRM